jgi:hypothetical protein
MKYETTAVYALGEMYAKIGAALMDERTTMKDLVDISLETGIDFAITIKWREPEVTSDEI